MDFDMFQYRNQAIVYGGSKIVQKKNKYKALKLVKIGKLKRLKGCEGIKLKAKHLLFKTKYRVTWIFRISLRKIFLL